MYFISRSLKQNLPTGMFSASSRASFGDILLIYFINSNSYHQDLHSEPQKSAYFHLWNAFWIQENLPVLFIFQSKCILLHIVNAYAMPLLLSHWVIGQSESAPAKSPLSSENFCALAEADKDLQTIQTQMLVVPFLLFPTFSGWNVVKSPLNQ